MSNPWAQSFDDLRSPYLQEKKAKKDYDGDGKIESGAKEYRGVVHNKIQKAKGGKADGQDTSSVKEGMYDNTKGNRFGDGEKGSKKRKEKLEKKHGMKMDNHPQFKKEAKEAPRKQKGAMAYDGPNKERSMAADRIIAKTKAKRNKMKMEHHQKDANGNPLEHGDGTPSNVDEGAPYTVNYADKKGNTPAYQNYMKGMKNKLTGKPLYKAGVGLDKAHYDPESEIIDEADKKGKGSGSKDACYHKVKSRYSVWPSAYASGALVKCRKVGAANWGNSSKKEEFDYYQMPMKSFGDMVGECWKTHRQEGTKMKGGRIVPNCVPKNESVEEAVKSPKLDIKTGVKNKIEINPEIKTEAAKAPEKK